jgi:uncharacterized protein (DUF2236 family)
MNPVSRSDIEALIAEISANSGNPQEGIFGPKSINWRINRESALFLGAGRAALLQLAHPWVAASLAEHSNLLSDPIARFHNTFRVVFTMIFGTRDQAFAASRHLHTLHASVRGELPKEIGRYKQGSHYEANETNALRWVYATLVESALIAYEYVMPPLHAEERAAYYEGSKIMAALFGIPPAALPKDWNAFSAYNKEMWESDSLGVNELSRSMAHAVLSGAGSWIHPPRWYRALTATWMPTRFREEFALEFKKADQRAVARSRNWLPHFYRNLPPSIRFVGPYHEARRRLANRPIHALTRWNNHFWIGQATLPFGD